MARFKNHLAAYGICHFSDERYWEWAGERTAPSVAGELDRVRRPIQNGTATDRETKRFYSFLARTDTDAIVHSSKLMPSHC